MHLLGGYHPQYFVVVERQVAPATVDLPLLLHGLFPDEEEVLQRRRHSGCAPRLLQFPAMVLEPVAANLFCNRWRLRTATTIELLLLVGLGY